LAVADTYDAMTSDRIYRKGLDPGYAFQEIVNNAGTQFDPKIVEAFKKSWLSGKEVYQSPGKGVRQVAPSGVSS
jgi:HD-GYP domain-containing protein (c-di-GMP phosphodiesterase class II)